MINVVFPKSVWRSVVAACAAALISLPADSATINLADQPLTTVSVPGNVLLSLSVEYPTAVSQAYPYASNPFSSATTYLGLR